MPLAVVLGGWHPFYRDSRIFESRYAPLAGYLQQCDDNLLVLDMQALVRGGLKPVDLFRSLYHPLQRVCGGLDQVAMEFRRAAPLDTFGMTYLICST